MDQDYARHQERCSECNMLLEEDIHIYIMTDINGIEDDMTICEYCRHDVDWEGWIDDQFDDELAVQE
jgi:uncharacterized protein with PIN domain